MEKIPHRPAQRNRAGLLLSGHALQLLALLRALAHRHPAWGGWSGLTLQALFSAPPPDVDETQLRARTLLAGRDAGALLVRAPGEALRGLIAGIETEMHAQERGGQAA